MSRRFPRSGQRTLGARHATPLTRIILHRFTQRASEGLEERFHSINLRTLLANRMLIQGFIVSDHVPRWKEIQKQLIGLLTKQKIRVHEKITDGIQNAPQTFIDLLEGRCLGKQIIKLS